MVVVTHAFCAQQFVIVSQTLLQLNPDRELIASLTRVCLVLQPNFPRMARISRPLPRLLKYHLNQCIQLESAIARHRFCHTASEPLTATPLSGRRMQEKPDNLDRRKEITPARIPHVLMTLAQDRVLDRPAIATCSAMTSVFGLQDRILIDD